MTLFMSVVGLALMAPFGISSKSWSRAPWWTLWCFLAGQMVMGLHFTIRHVRGELPWLTALMAVLFCGGALVTTRRIQNRLRAEWEENHG